MLSFPTFVEDVSTAILPSTHYVFQHLSFTIKTGTAFLSSFAFSCCRNHGDIFVCQCSCLPRQPRSCNRDRFRFIPPLFCPRCHFFVTHTLLRFLSPQGTLPSRPRDRVISFVGQSSGISSSITASAANVPDGQLYYVRSIFLGGGRGRLGMFILLSFLPFHTFCFTFGPCCRFFSLNPSGLFARFAA